ncbi:hypothetical protein AMTRI_Chr05g61820 [Amborella trichopoda]
MLPLLLGMFLPKSSRLHMQAHPHDVMCLHMQVMHHICWHITKSHICVVFQCGANPIMIDAHATAFDNIGICIFLFSNMECCGLKGYLPLIPYCRGKKKFPFSREWGWGIGG